MYLDITHTNNYNYNKFVLRFCELYSQLLFLQLGFRASNFKLELRATNERDRSKSRELKTLSELFDFALTN